MKASPASLDCGDCRGSAHPAAGIGTRVPRRPSALTPVPRCRPPATSAALQPEAFSFLQFLIVYFLEPRFLGCVINVWGQRAYAVERHGSHAGVPARPHSVGAAPAKPALAQLLWRVVLCSSHTSAPRPLLLLQTPGPVLPPATVTHPHPAPSRPCPGRSVTSAHDGSLTDVSVPR